jgi:hypothetical protein
MSAATLEQIANFPAPNYVNPQTRVAPLAGLAALGLSIMIPFIVARIYVRYLRGVFWRDDWIIVAAAVRQPSCFLLEIAENTERVV